MLGMLSPSSRGSLVTATILLFVFFGYGSGGELLNLRIFENPLELILLSFSSLTFS